MELNNTMTISHIEHIGIAVKNLQEAIKMYENLFGLSCYKIEEIPDQRVRTAFFQIGQTKIELLESTHPEGPISKFIERKGETVHHIAIAVKNLADTLKEMEIKGCQLIDQAPRQGAEGMNIAFLHPKSTGGVLIELCEDPSIKK
jgi:methylmalonyl-CoA/ethylmalonyl-CoA epimerase